jgi:hypothetical protein
MDLAAVDTQDVCGAQFKKGVAADTREMVLLFAIGDVDAVPHTPF